MLKKYLIVVLFLIVIQMGGPVFAISPHFKGVVVPNAGTAVQLETDYSTAYCVVVKAKHTNVGLIYLGETKTLAETANGRFTLEASQGIQLCVGNLNAIWINSSVDAEGVEYAIEIP